MSNLLTVNHDLSWRPPASITVQSHSSNLSKVFKNFNYNQSHFHTTGSLRTTYTRARPKTRGFGFNNAAKFSFLKRKHLRFSSRERFQLIFNLKKGHSANLEHFFIWTEILKELKLIRSDFNNLFPDDCNFSSIKKAKSWSMRFYSDFYCVVLEVLRWLRIALIYDGDSLSTRWHTNLLFIIPPSVQALGQIWNLEIQVNIIYRQGTLNFRCLFFAR